MPGAASAVRFARTLRWREMDSNFRFPVAKSSSEGSNAHRRILRVDRLDDREPVGMGLLHFHRIAGVVAVWKMRR